MASGVKAPCQSFPFHRKGRGGCKELDVTFDVHNLKGRHAYDKKENQIKASHHRRKPMADISFKHSYLLQRKG